MTSNTDDFKELLETIDRKAEAGLCQMTHAGTRAFLKDIRGLVEEARNVPETEAMQITDAQIAHLWGCSEQEIRFARGMLSSKPAGLVGDALKAVAEDIDAMPADELRAIHESHRNGDIATALRELHDAPAPSCGDAEQSAAPMAAPPTAESPATNKEIST